MAHQRCYKRCKEVSQKERVHLCGEGSHTEARQRRETLHSLVRILEHQLSLVDLQVTPASSDLNTD
jgi:hypothetical protein